MTTNQTQLNDFDLQEKAKGLWQREGGHCVSSLVHTLAQGLGTDEAGTDMADLIDQAFELSCPIDDWEEVARGAGASNVRGIWEGRVPGNGESAFDTAQEWCEYNCIEPSQREVYEHWIVSDWLADQLAARGEKVAVDFAGLTIWARTTTGQAVYIDHVMEQITRDLYADHFA